MSDTCPHCEPLTAWGGAPEMFDKLRKWHEADHPQSEVIDLVKNGLAKPLNLSNPPKQARTTPSTDLDKILNDFEIVQYYGKTDPKDDLTPTKAVLKAKLTEVITQERNKAWEEATAKFEACLPEKFMHPVYLQHEAIFLFPGYVDTTHPLHNSADVRMVQEHDMKCLRCDKVFGSLYEANNTHCDMVEGQFKEASDPFFQFVNNIIDQTRDNWYKLDKT